VVRWPLDLRGQTGNGIEKKRWDWKREVISNEIMHFGVAKDVRIVRGIGGRRTSARRYARHSKPEARRAFQKQRELGYARPQL